MKKRIFCRLKRCLKDFKTKDHLCLFPDLFLLNFFPKWSVMPPVSGLGSFSLFSSFLFGWAYSPQLFLWEAQIFWILWIFFIMPQLCVGSFDHWVFSHLPPVWGVILVNVILKNVIGSKWDCKGFISASWKDYQRWHFLILNSCIEDQ
jgi:hypothetical protein